MEALRGDLTTFPLDRVIAMLAGARRTGVLRVERGARTGRIFFVEGAITYATTREGEGSVADVAAAPIRPARERRGRAAVEPLSTRETVLHQIAEVILRLDEGRGGRFWFVDGVTTRAYGERPPERFDHDEVMRAVRERREAWRRIRRFLPGGDVRIRLRPRLEAPVTIEPREWRLLIAVGEGATAAEIAERTGTAEFLVAEGIVGLMRRGLVVTADEAAAMTGDGDAGVIVVELEPAAPEEDTA